MVSSMEHSRNSIFSICDSPQKSSAAQKVYRAEGLALSHRERLSPAGRRNVFVRVSFRRKVCYTGLAALPADIVRKGGEGSDPYSHDFGVGHSKCDLPLHLQVA